MKRLKTLLTVALMLSGIVGVLAADVKHLKFIQPATLSTNIVGASASFPNRANRMNHNRGTINILYEDGAMVPDSMKRCIAAAAELWELKILNKEPINIKFYYDNLPESEVFEVDLATTYIEGSKLLYPMSYLRQFNDFSVGEDDIFESDYNIDGAVFLNGGLKWNCDFSGNCHVGYNSLTQALRGIGICLGFGSSIHQFNGTYYFGGGDPTIFDSKLVLRDEFISDIDQDTPEFNQAMMSDNVEFLMQNGDRFSMKSLNLNDYNQLVYIDNPRSLMHYDCGESKSFMSIDDTTVALLKDIGWNQEVASNIKIKAADLDNSGYGTALAPHTFSYESKLNLSSIKWEYHLRMADGSFALQKTDDSDLFTIPKVDNPIGCYVDCNGNLSGKITVIGKNIMGETLSETYHVSLGLKPEIVAIRNIRQIPTGEYTFILQFDVEYLGTDDLNVSIESDNSSKLNQWKIYEPIIAHVKTTELYNFYYHWVDVSVENEYGKTIETIEIPDTYNSYSSTQSEYFVKLVDPQFNYELVADGTRVSGDFSFNIITNDPRCINVKVTTPYIHTPWSTNYYIEEHPTYKKFSFTKKCADGFKFKVCLPGRKIESNILSVNDFIDKSDMDLISGVENVSYKDNINIEIFGNRLIFTGGYGIESVSVDIFNIYGKKVYSCFDKINNLELNVSEFIHGIYFVRIKNNGRLIVKKITL